MPNTVANVIDVYVFRRRGADVEFLMLKRAPGVRLGGTWQAVHGRVEPGETAVAAALRELGEETGLRPIGFWQLEYVNTFYLTDDDVVLMCPCFAAEVPPDADVTLCHESTDYRWESAERAPESFMWPGQRSAVREIMTEIITPGLAEPHMRIELQGRGWL